MHTVTDKAPYTCFLRLSKINTFSAFKLDNKHLPGEMRLNDVAIIELVQFLEREGCIGRSNIDSKSVTL